MDILLTDTEIRVLGCLMEKAMATPEYYPLSLNGLTNGCNQKSNRNPVVSFDEETVVYALDGLRERKLVGQSNLGRVPKYEQIFAKELNLVVAEEAVLCVLFLRGPQTLGEIRGRSERLYSFAGLDEVEKVIANLEEMRLVTKLARQPGRKESRYAHLLSGEPQENVAETVANQEAATVVVRREKKESAELQKQIDELREELEKLRLEFADFKSQFE